MKKAFHVLAYVALAAGLYGTGIRHGRQAATVGPALIAQGCEGAGGDLWASEESDFPTQCEHIERWLP